MDEQIKALQEIKTMLEDPDTWSLLPLAERVQHVIDLREREVWIREMERKAVPVDAGAPMVVGLNEKWG
jgi:hypothetical protein